jgi:hypothetical protein
MGCATATGTTTSSTTGAAPSTTFSARVTTTTSVPGSTAVTTTTVQATTTTDPPTYRASIRDVTIEELAHSHRPDCPVGPEDLVGIDLVHWGLDGAIHQGTIVVARSQGESVAAIFGRLFEVGYPIQSVVPIGELPIGIEDSDPDYNNTSGLHCRPVAGTTRWSEHARGLAIDVNPLLNPYKTSNRLWPVNSARYLDRSLGEPGMIVDGDEVVEVFAAHGWHWGGYWTSSKDYQHFSVSGR